MTTDPTAAASADRDTLAAFLASIELAAHFDAFCGAGYDSLSYLREIAHDADALHAVLDDVGVTAKGHRRRFVHYLQHQPGSARAAAPFQTMPRSTSMPVPRAARRRSTDLDSHGAAPPSASSARLATASSMLDVSALRHAPQPTPVLPAGKELAQSPTRSSASGRTNNSNSSRSSNHSDVQPMPELERKRSSLTRLNASDNASHSQSPRSRASTSNGSAPPSSNRLSTEIPDDDSSSTTSDTASDSTSSRTLPDAGDVVDTIVAAATAATAIQADASNRSHDDEEDDDSALHFSKDSSTLADDEDADQEADDVATTAVAADAVPKESRVASSNNSSSSGVAIDMPPSPAPTLASPPGSLAPADSVVWRLGCYEQNHSSVIGKLLTMLKETTDNLNTGPARADSMVQQFEYEYRNAVQVMLQPQEVSRGKIDHIACGNNEIVVLRRDKTLWRETASSYAASIAAANGASGSDPQVADPAGSDSTSGLVDSGSVPRTSSLGESVRHGTLKRLTAHPVAQLSQGASHAAALLFDGSLIMWGANHNTVGSLTHRSIDAVKALVTHQTSPDDVARTGVHRCELKLDIATSRALSRTKLAVVACGFGPHSAGIVADSGQLLTWGLNDAGQLGRVGDGLRPGVVNLPVRVALVACGARHTLAVGIDGRMFAFGINANGQCGVPPSQVPITTPKEVPWGKTVRQRIGQVGKPTFTALACGIAHSVALLRDGSVLTWGLNAHGELGRVVPYSKSYKPAFVAGVDQVRHLSCGPHSIAFATIGGEALIAGRLCGEGFTRHTATPRVIDALGDRFITEVHAGATHHAVLESVPLSDTFGLVVFRMRHDVSVPAPSELAPLLLQMQAIEAGALVQRAMRTAYRAQQRSPRMQLTRSVFDVHFDRHATLTELRMWPLVGEVQLTNTGRSGVRVVFDRLFTAAGDAARWRVTMTPTSAHIKPGKRATITFKLAVPEQQLEAGRPNAIVQLAVHSDDPKWLPVLALPLVLHAHVDTLDSPQLLRQPSTVRVPRNASTHDAPTSQAPEPPVRALAASAPTEASPAVTTATTTTVTTTTAATTTTTMDENFANVARKFVLQKSDIVDVEYPPLGAGSFGVVVKAKVNGRAVAVKMSSQGSSSMQSDALHEWLREIEMLQQVRHMNIVEFIGLVIDPAMVVVELMQCSLYQQYSSQPERLRLPSRCVAILNDVANGLQYLHCFKPAILHRDLKSANVLIDDAGTAKVCDFGSSRHETRSIMTVQRGTVSWMAPEVMSKASYSTPSDVYSFAIIMWEVWARQLPWSTVRFDFQIEQRVLKGDRPDLKPVAHAPPDALALMRDAWHANPAERPSAHDCWRRLRSLAKQVRDPLD